MKTKAAFATLAALAAIIAVALPIPRDADAGAAHAAAPPFTIGGEPPPLGHWSARAAQPLSTSPFTVTVAA